MKKTPIMDISAPVVSHNLDAQEHEREVVLMALRWPSDSAPFYAKLVEPMAVPPQRTWVMVEYEPPAKTRRSMGLPRKPGDFDILAGRLTASDEIDLDAPIMAVEVKQLKLDKEDRPEAWLDERSVSQAEALLEWPFEFAALFILIPEKTRGRGWLAAAPTIDPLSILPELDAFRSPGLRDLGMLAHTIKTVPGLDPARSAADLAPRWLRAPTFRTPSHAPASAVRRDLADKLGGGDAFLLNGGGPYLILPCWSCDRYVMTDQSTPICGSKLLPPCAKHAPGHPAVAPEAAALVERWRQPIVVRLNGR